MGSLLYFSTYSNLAVIMLEYLYRGGEAEGMLTLSGERKTFPARRCGIGTSAELKLGSAGPLARAWVSPHRSPPCPAPSHPPSTRKHHSYHLAASLCETTRGKTPVWGKLLFFEQQHFIDLGLGHSMPVTETQLNPVEGGK